MLKIHSNKPKNHGGINYHQHFIDSKGYIVDIINEKVEGEIKDFQRRLRLIKKWMDRLCTLPYHNYSKEQCFDNIYRLLEDKKDGKRQSKK